MTRGFFISLLIAMTVLAPSVASESTRSTINPGNFFEYPPAGSGGVKLMASEVVTYSWIAQRADGIPLKIRFNVHYNEAGGEPRYAVGPLVTAADNGSFVAPQQDGYYFMWENTQPTPVDVFITYTQASDSTPRENATSAAPVALLAPVLALAALVARRRTK